LSLDIKRILIKNKMKKIYLIRHGKAEDGYGKADFERELIAKGEKKTRKIAQFLAEKKISVDLMLVSMAQRTKQTADILAETISVPKTKIQEEKALYLASTNGILDVIFGVDDQINHLMMVGHNPGISSLATYLSNEDIDWLPTSAVVAIDLKTDHWNKIPDAIGKLDFYIKPSDI
jgi:phosphohistidine phosphatase